MDLDERWQQPSTWSIVVLGNRPKSSLAHQRTYYRTNKRTHSFRWNDHHFDDWSSLSKIRSHSIIGIACNCKSWIHMVIEVNKIKSSFDTRGWTTKLLIKRSQNFMRTKPAHFLFRNSILFYSCLVVGLVFVGIVFCGHSPSSLVLDRFVLSKKNKLHSNHFSISLMKFINKKEVTFLYSLNFSECIFH